MLTVHAGSHSWRVRDPPPVAPKKVRTRLIRHVGEGGVLYLLCMDDPAAKLQTTIHLLNELTDQPVSDWMTADRVSVDPGAVSADATDTMLAGRFRFSRSCRVEFSAAS